MTQDTAALRAERLKRLATAQSSQQSAPVVEAPASATVAVEQEKSVPETLVAHVLDPKAVTKAAEIQLHLFNERTSDPHWVVFASGKPVAEISLSAQDDVERVAKIFTTEAYAHGIINASAHLELSEILEGVKARPYVAAVSGNEVVKNLESQLKAASTDELRRAKANLRNDMTNAMSLVFTAGSKNYISENSLKDALFNRMQASGLEQDRIIAIIEAAWQEKAVEYFDECMKQANKWMDLHPEAYQDIAEQIHSLPQRTPTIEVDASVSTVPSVSKNIPFMTYTAGAQEEAADPKEELRSIFGFRRNHQAGKTSR